MTARSVFKLITKTCTYSYSSYPSSPLYTIPQQSEASHKKRVEKSQRSFSQPARTRNNPKLIYRKGTINPLRKLSKSLHNVRGTWQYEEDTTVEESPKETTTSTYRSSYMSAQPIREPQIDVIDNENTREFRYELEESTRNRRKKNVFDVFEYMTAVENNKPNRIFPHLQPNNLKAFGSNENLFFPSAMKRPQKIVYPMTNTKTRNEQKRKRFDDVQYKEYSSYMKEKEYPGYEEKKKIAICETKSKNLIGIDGKKNYSTTIVKRNQPLFNVKRSRDKLKITKSARKFSDVATRIEEILKKNYQQQNVRVAKPVNTNTSGRQYNTSSKTHEKCNEFVTVKLGELQEECRKVKKCKPKKLSFGKLPKMTPPVCPCIEEQPLKEGKPLIPLKKRSEPKEDNKRDCDLLACTTPRADANYKIKSKTLPPIQVQECPCVEQTWTDLKIKRLPKRKVPEPPKVCEECIGEECCPPRSDGKINVVKKQLPILRANACPCIEPEPLKDVPLKPLKPQTVKERPRICPPLDSCEDNPRADANLTVKPKTLPLLKPECLCIEAPPMKEAPPLPRLRKIKYVEKPRDFCEDDVCDLDLRADKNLKFEKKKLPKFIPQSCPCVEEELPSLPVKLKRLKMRFVPKEREKICPDIAACPPRADDGLIIKPKQLPQIKLYDCPCVEEEIKNAPPLKRLIPKPVLEPSNECPSCIGHECCPPRSDDGMKIPKKNLPILKPGSCPCPEDPPLKDSKPLAKLKARKVVDTTPPCTQTYTCDVPRADGDLKVVPKKLPKLPASTCPCIEPTQPEDVKPLPRLRKIDVPEPVKVCPAVDDCLENPRSDEDDWMYWKRIEVKSTNECGDVSKIGKRDYSTSCKNDNVNAKSLRYDVSQLKTDQADGKSYNVVIDIKPAPPLILTQSPISLAAKVEEKYYTRPQMKPIDYVAFVIHKSNNITVKNSASNMKKNDKIANFTDVALLFNTINRFISTYRSLYQYSEKLKTHQTPSCECPIDDRHLQPKNPIITPKETFMATYPDDDVISASVSKGRRYHRGRKDEECLMNDEKKEESLCSMKENKVEEELCPEEYGKLKKKELTLWERIVNYFKARPGCPSPEEFRKLRLKEDAEKAASKAGLCLYDPKEMLRKNEKELPKVITAGSTLKDCRK